MFEIKSQGTMTKYEKMRFANKKYIHGIGPVVRGSKCPLSVYQRNDKTNFSWQTEQERQEEKF